MNLKPKMLRLTLDESPCIYAGLARWELEKLDLLTASYISANVDYQKLKNSIKCIYQAWQKRLRYYQVM